MSAKIAVATEHRSGFSLIQGPAGRRVRIKLASVARDILTRPSPLRSTFMTNLWRRAFGNALPILMSEGAQWRDTHNALAPFFTPKYVEEHYAPVIKTVANQTFSTIARQSIASGWHELSIRVEAKMRQTTTRIMGHVLFGAALTMEEADRIAKILDLVTRVSSGSFASILGRRLGAVFYFYNQEQYRLWHASREQRRAVNEFSAWIDHKINTAAQDPDTTIIGALRKRYAHQTPLQQKRSVASECMLLFIAGIETTASALTFAIAEIANNPDVHAKVLAELMQVAAPGPSYRAQVFQETLRLHSVVQAVTRRAGPDDSISGVPIPPDTIYNIFLPRYHRESKVWESSHRFDPGRFAAPLSSPQREYYLPYGLGPAICIGRNLASSEANLIIKAFLLHFGLRGKATVGPVAKSSFDTLRPREVCVPVCAYMRGDLHNS